MQFDSEFDGKSSRRTSAVRKDPFVNDLEAWARYRVSIARGKLRQQFNLGSSGAPIVAMRRFALHGPVSELRTTRYWHISSIHYSDPSFTDSLEYGSWEMIISDSTKEEYGTQLSFDKQESSKHMA
jgi:hypothetical protein